MVRLPSMPVIATAAAGMTATAVTATVTAAVTTAAMGATANAGGMAGRRATVAAAAWNGGEAVSAAHFVAFVAVFEAMAFAMAGEPVVMVPV